MSTAVLRKIMRKIGIGRKRQGPLRTELQNLHTNISRTQRRMYELSEEFTERRMYCCPCCAFPEYSDLKLKQERRELRIRQLEAKIKKDSCHVERTQPPT